jgi:hypothetical protein
MKLKKELYLYKGTVDYLQVGDVFMLKEDILLNEFSTTETFLIEKGRTLTIIKKPLDNWDGLTMKMIDSYDRSHIVKREHFIKMIKVV